jgi:hypothetical protein
MPISAMTVQFLQSPLAECGVALPPSAQTALDTLAALQAEASRDVVAEALAAAISTPLTPKNAGKRVQELATALTARTRAVEAAQHYERAVLDQFRDAIVAHTDDLIIAMRPYFDAAAKVVQEAGALIDPDRPPTTSDGLHVLEVAQALDDAQRRLSVVQTARIRVCEMGGYAEPDASWFIAEAADSDALALARMWKKRGDWHRLARAGFTLRLNTPAEAAAVVSNAAANANAAEKAKQRARVQANRDPLRDAAYSRLGL